MDTQNNKKFILVVEDDAALQEAIKLKLGNKGIKVAAASTGEEALALLKKEKPDLVWLDFLLPRMNGLEFLEKVREEDSLKDLTVVMVSVSSGPSKIKKAYSLGIASYIVKSEGTLDEIINKVEKHIRPFA